MLKALTKTLDLKFVKEVREGKELFETRRFRNLKTSSADADILAVADAISKMSETSAREILVTVQSEITPEV